MLHLLSAAERCHQTASSSSTPSLPDHMSDSDPEYKPPSSRMRRETPPKRGGGGGGRKRSSGEEDAESGTPAVKRRNCRRWSTAEDERLREAVAFFRERDWKRVAERMGPGYTADQCNQHWYRVLDPKIRRGGWDEEEDELLIKTVMAVGASSWKRVSEVLKGRTDLMCRNRWQALEREGRLAHLKVPTRGQAERRQAVLDHKKQELTQRSSEEKGQRSSDLGGAGYTPVLPSFSAMEPSAFHGPQHMMLPPQNYPHHQQQQQPQQPLPSLMWPGMWGSHFAFPGNLGGQLQVPGYFPQQRSEPSYLGVKGSETSIYSAPQQYQQQQQQQQQHPQQPHDYHHQQQQLGLHLTLPQCYQGLANMIVQQQFAQRQQQYHHQPQEQQQQQQQNHHEEKQESEKMDEEGERKSH